MEILFVGSKFHEDSPSLFGGQLDIKCYFVEDGETARHFLHKTNVDVLLIARQLADGSGLHFASTLSGFPVCAFVSFWSEIESLWLPVIDKGELCIGTPALNNNALVQKIEDISSRKRAASDFVAKLVVQSLDLEALLNLPEADAHAYLDNIRASICADPEDK